MPDAERQFLDLIFCASKKYPSWDPEVAVAVGDYRRITHKGVTVINFLTWGWIFFYWLKAWTN